MKKKERSGNTTTKMARVKRICNKTLVAAICATTLITGSLIATNKVAAEAPYALTAGGNTVCYVSSKDAADKVLASLVRQYTAEDAALRAVENNEVKIERAEGSKVEGNGIKNVKEAIDCVDEALKENEDASITVVGLRTDTETFTPAPAYEQDDSMFAGETVIKKEGKDGSKDVTKLLTTVNGEVTGEKVIKSVTTDKGESAIIVKGTLGLPDGEDWKTYDGDPVFNDAADLIATCKKYIGAPYKYGGHSLTNGIDCVQYVRQMFAKYGISIPNKHSQIQKVGKGVSLKDAQPGDIVCWTHHVGIYIGDGKVINATRRKGVTISSVHMNKKLVTIRRVPRN